MLKRCIITIIITLFAAGVNAQWRATNTSSTVVCASPTKESEPVVISDSAGGVIIAWSSAVAGRLNGEVRAQRFDIEGNALWTTNGLTLSGGLGIMKKGRMIEDGTGGAFLASGNWLQRISPDGKSLWIRTEQHADSLLPDGNGGLIAFWHEEWGGSQSRDAFAQRISADGKDVWPGGPRQLTFGRDTIYSEQPISDGAGGIFFSWYEWGYDGDRYRQMMYVQRINHNGDNVWSQPIRIITDDYELHNPVLCSDETSGVYVLWHSSGHGIRAQHLNQDGSAQWPTGGLELLTSNLGYATPLAATGDGSRGMIISWIDTHDPFTSITIRAQRVNSSGTTLWQQGGVLAGEESSTLYDQHLVSDGIGGAVLIWAACHRWDPTVEIYGSFNSEIYGQRFAPDGTKLWAPEGTTISIAEKHRYGPAAAKDSNNRFVVCWVDERNNSDVWDLDLYGALIGADGQLKGKLPPPNSRPIANSDSYVMDEDSQLRAETEFPEYMRNVSVLYNDFDEEGTPLAAQLKTLPRHGTLEFHTSGTFVYTPQTGFFGEDRFTYEVSDGNLSADTTVTIQIDEVCGPFSHYDPGNCEYHTELLTSWISPPVSVPGKRFSKVTGHLLVNSLRNIKKQNTLVHLYLSNDRCWDQSDRLLKVLSVKNLRSEKARTLKLSLRLPSETPEGMFLIAWVNKDYQSKDCDPSNNLQSVRIVPKPTR